MNVETEVESERVTVYADGDVLGTLGREFWEDWATRVDGDPESRLSSCLASADRPVGGRET